MDFYTFTSSTESHHVLRFSTFHTPSIVRQPSKTWTNANTSEDLHTQKRIKKFFFYKLVYLKKKKKSSITVRSQKTRKKAIFKKNPTKYNTVTIKSGHSYVKFCPSGVGNTCVSERERNKTYGFDTL